MSKIKRQKEPNTMGTTCFQYTEKRFLSVWSWEKRIKETVLMCDNVLHFMAGFPHKSLLKKKKRKKRTVCVEIFTYKTTKAILQTQMLWAADNCGPLSTVGSLMRNQLRNLNVCLAFMHVFKMKLNAQFLILKQKFFAVHFPVEQNSALCSTNTTFKDWGPVLWNTCELK